MAPEDEGGSSTGPQLTEDDNCGRMEDDRSSDSGVPPGTLGSSTVTDQLCSKTSVWIGAWKWNFLIFKIPIVDVRNQPL